MQEPNQAWTPAEQGVLWRGRRQSHSNSPKRILGRDHGTERGQQMDQRGIAVTSGELRQPIPECIDVVTLWIGGIRRWMHVAPKRSVQVADLRRGTRDLGGLGTTFPGSTQAHQDARYSVRDSGLDEDIRP